MERIGKLSEIEVKPTIGMDVPWNYRNKAQYPIGVKAVSYTHLDVYKRQKHRLAVHKYCTKTAV